MAIYNTYESHFIMHHCVKYFETRSDTQSNTAISTMIGCLSYQLCL